MLSSDSSLHKNRHELHDNDDIKFDDKDDKEPPAKTLRSVKPFKKRKYDSLINIHNSPIQFNVHFSEYLIICLISGHS